MPAELKSAGEGRLTLSGALDFDSIDRMVDAPAMAVGVEVAGVAVVVGMEVHALAPRAPQHVGPEQDQHQADRELQCVGGPRRQCLVDQQHYPAKDEQRQRVTHSPGGTLTHRAAHAIGARAQAGDGGEVIGLEGVLQA